MWGSLSRRRRAARPEATNVELRAFALDPDPRVRMVVIENPKTPLGLIAALSQDSDPLVREAAVTNPRITPSIRALATTIDPSENCPRTRNEALALLLRDGAAKCTVKSHETPTEALRELKFSPHVAVLRTITTHPNVDSEILRDLIDFGIPLVTSWVAQFSAAADEDLLRLAQASPESALTVAANRAASESVLAVLARHPVEHVRNNVAGNNSAGPGVLSQLVRDDSPRVRAEVASNWNTSARDLDVLSNDSSPEVRASVLSHQNVWPSTARAVWARDGVCCPSNKNTPSDVLAAYFHTLTPNPGFYWDERQRDTVWKDDGGSKLAIAANPNTPPSILLKLSQYPDLYVAEAVAGNPGAPREALEDLYRLPHLRSVISRYHPDFRLY